MCLTLTPTLKVGALTGICRIHFHWIDWNVKRAMILFSCCFCVVPFLVPRWFSVTVVLWNGELRCYSLGALHTHSDFPDFYVTFWHSCSMFILFISLHFSVLFGRIEGKFYSLRKKFKGNIWIKKDVRSSIYFFLTHKHFEIAKYFFTDIFWLLLLLVECDKLSCVILLVIVVVCFSLFL